MKNLTWLPYWAICAAVVAAALSARGSEQPIEPDQSSSGAALNEKEQRALAERKDLMKQFESAKKEGNSDEALRLAVQVAACEAELLALLSSEAPDRKANISTVRKWLISTQRWIAARYEERLDFNLARETHDRQVVLLVDEFGNEHWQVKDARLALAHLDIIEKLSPADRGQLSEAAESQRNAIELSQQRRHGDAIKRAEDTLHTYQAILGERHRDYANILNTLGTIYYRQSSYDQAELPYSKALEIRRVVLGEKHPDYAQSLNNLADLYQAQEDYVRAEPLLYKAFEIREAVLGKKHGNYAISLNNLISIEERLATRYAEREDFTAARQARQRLITLLVEKLANEHWQVTDARLALAHVDIIEKLSPADRARLSDAAQLQRKAVEFYQQEKYSDAIEHAQDAMHIQKEVLGEQHRDYATSLHGLARLYELQRDYARAESLWRQAVEIRKAVLGDKHPDYATSLNNLAALHQSQGNYARAEPLYRQVLEIYKAVFGEKHPNYIGTLSVLAGLCESQREYPRAEALLRQSLEIRRNLLGERHLGYAHSLNDLAALYFSQGDYVRAEQVCRQALEVTLAAVGERHADYATNLSNLAESCFKQRDYSRAEPLMIRALELRKEIFGTNHSEYATSLNNLGLLYAEQGEFERAEPLLQQSLAIRRAVLGETHPAYAVSLNNQAELYAEQGEYARAEALHRKALEIKKAAVGELHPDYATSLNNLALLYRKQGDYARAEPLYRQALEIDKAALGETHPDCATSLNNLASLYAAQGDFVRAEPLLLQSLEIRKLKLGDQHPDYAHSLNNLAEHYNARGDYTRTESLYRQAIEIAKAKFGEQHAELATYLNNLALFYKSQGDYARSEPLLRQALKISKAKLGEQHPKYATSLSSLGLFYELLGDYARAEPLLSQALDIKKATLGEKHPVYATGLNNLALFYESQGDYERAEALLRQALEITKAALVERHPDYVTSLRNLASLYADQRKYALADTLYLQALEITRATLGEKHPDYACGLDNLGMLYADQGEYVRAEPLMRQAVEITAKLGEKHPDYISRLNNLAGLYCFQGEDVRAEPLLRKVLEATESSLDSASAVQSERQQLAMQQATRPHFDSYQAVAVKSGQASEMAYRSLLRWKGMVWTRQRQMRAASDRPELAPTVSSLQSVAARLATLAHSTPDPKNLAIWRRQLEELTLEKEELEQEVVVKSAAYREAKQAVTLDDLRSCLPLDAALVDFLEYRHFTPAPKEKPGRGSFERRLLAFVVRADQELALVDLGSVAKLTAAADAWLAAYGRSPESQRAGKELREQVWTPLELAGVKLVLISPDGVLGRIPLAALPGKTPGTYLLEEWTVATVPVPQAVPGLLKANAPLGEQPELKNLLLVGGVDYDGAPLEPTAPQAKKAFGQRPVRGSQWRAFSPLDGTQGEVATIEKMYRDIFGTDGFTTLEKAEASEERLVALAAKHRYLHLATHGFFAPPELRSALAPQPDRNEPPAIRRDRIPQLVGHHPGLLSGLALAGANREPVDERPDGILTAEEVQTLDLRNVELATLSACETGLGEVAGGEGVLGLQRAFQIAGARTTITSLWKVDDIQTRALMERFYRNLWEKDLSKVEALREAQLWMLREGKRGVVRVDRQDPQDERLSPYFWAAFVLSGDWR